MPYDYALICSHCGYIIEKPTHNDYRVMDGEERFPYCPQCDHIMQHRVVGISGPGDYHHTSDSLAFHPDDIPEHRQKFPDVEVTPEGQPMFTSVKQQQRYSERCGFHKKRQRTHNLGRQKIA